ncbi:MAG TPA: DNA repair protein RecN [Flavisolibacter sp.]|nr:DNA repair protein RecN [Flavisolibacter sp.]
MLLIMLNRLSIKNYAIIDQLDIDFSSHLNIITGETGAGKSIIVGALGLILGQRAESSILLNKDKKCIIEGYFKGNSDDASVINFLKDNELDNNDELVVRREITSNGKSRAFINDTPVNLAQLNILSSLLVDLHQQFDTIELGESDFQREVLDALTNNFPLTVKYRSVYEAAITAKRELGKLKEEKSKFEKEFDYNQFQFNELEEAGLQPDELELLDQELKILSNAEGIKAALSNAYDQLEQSEEPLLRQLKTITNQLQQYAETHPQLPVLIERLHSSYLELQDIAEETDHLNNAINSDASEMERINDRLSLGYRLLKKHGVHNTNELIQIREELNQKLQAVLNIEESILKAENTYNDLSRSAEDMAGKISEVRRSAIKPLEQEVNRMLVQVGMPGARIKVDINKTELNINGFDDVVFLFDANKNNQFQPLRKVASGGELSRLMLCIKSLVASSMNLPTLIFDEIDTGISGEAAKQVGSIMKELSFARQVLCITHQPQIAGKADAHYLVYKAIKNNTVTTGVRILDKDERIIAIAKMLSGEKPTAAAMENAREMVMN